MPVVKWDDFSGGEYGGLAPRFQSHNQWTGLNMFLYDDGRVGPRGGLNVNVGAGNGITVVNRAVSAMAHGTNLLIHAKTGTTTHKIFRVARDSSSSATADTITPNPGTWIPGKWINTGDDEAYLIAPNSGILKYTVSTTTIATVTTSAFTAGVGNAGALYRDRMYATEYLTNRVRYSVVQNYTDWATAAGDGTDSGFFDVGDDTPIIWMGTVKDQLWIMKWDQTIWTYQGTPSRDSLRLLIPGRAEGNSNYSAGTVVTPHQFAVLRSGEIIGGDSFWPRVVSITSQGVTDMNYQLGKMKELFGVSPGPSDGSSAFVGSAATHEMDGAVVCFQGDTSINRSFHWIRRNGAWTVHEFDAAGLGDTTLEPYSSGTTVSDDGVLWVLILSDSDTKIWPCYTLLAENRPGDGSDTYAQHRQGDEFTIEVEQTAAVDDCTLETSSYFDPSGDDLRIRRIVVEFLAFDTNSSDTNHFDLTVEVRASDDGEEQTITLDSWDEANASATALGSPRRFVATPDGDIQASMFTVKLGNIRGVAVESIRADVEINDLPRR